MARPGADHRQAAQPGGDPAQQGGVELGGRRPRLLGDQAVEVGDHVAHLGDDAQHGIRVGAAGVEPPGGAARDGVHPSGHDVHLTDGGDAALRLGGAPGRDDQGGQAEHGVLALGERGGAGVVGLAGHVDPPAPVRPDVAADPDGVAEVDEAAALLDVQLDEGADPGEGLVVAAEGGRVAAGAAHRLGHRHAVVVGEPAGPVGPERTGDDAGPRAGDAEARALLVGEVDDPHRAGRGEAVVPQLVDRRERTDDPERAVEGATVGNRVQVRADDDAGVTGGHRGIRVAPPGPLVAHPVGGEVEPASAHSPANHSRRAWSSRVQANRW